MLQTAKATATDLNDLSFANIQIMFDSGSQRVYVNEHLKQILNLKTLRTEKLILKLVSTIFYQIFIFPQNDSPLKTMKNVFYFI